jgi:choline dehydrogenase-like flavoprotein
MKSSISHDFIHFNDRIPGRAQFEFNVHPPEKKIELVSMVEMPPIETNSVGLSKTKTDDFDDPVPQIDLSIDDISQATMKQSLNIFRELTERMNVQITDAVSEIAPNFAKHHMGTTRMGHDPNTSVVNPNLRTHDIKNLYIVSSSTFPTGLAVNPTLTIVALALRASDHIIENK